MKKIAEYWPPEVREIKEFEIIDAVENPQIRKFQEAIENLIKDNFVVTAAEHGIGQYEKLLQITPDKSIESLEFRRDRILNRLNMFPPFTLPFLHRLLSDAVGRDNYDVTMDYANYTLYLESSATNQQWFEEISFTINSIKPANIVFINKPLLTENLLMSEEIETAQYKYYYYLGNWKLGENPFTDYINTKIEKRGDSMSLESCFLEGMSQAAYEKIDKILINNSIEITSLNKRNEGAVAIIEYSVKENQTEGKPVENIKLLDAEGNYLTNTKVYVPIQVDILVKHTIKIKEGV